MRYQNRAKLILCLSLVSLTVFSCGGEAAKPAENGNSALGTDSSAETEGITEELPPLAAGKDYGGAAVTFYADTYTGTDFGSFYVSEKENGEVINDAASRRTRAVEEALNVDITYAEPEKDCGKFIRSVLTGEGVYDFLTAAVTLCTDSVLQGTLYNLNDIEGLDLSRSWWLPYVNQELAVEGTQYLATGYFDMATFARTSAVFFSSKLAETYDLGDFYALVGSGEWTFDKLLSLSAAVSKDLNGDGAWDMDDQYGLCGGFNMNGMLIMTTGYHFTESAADGSRTLAGCTERLIDFNRMLYETYQQPWYFNCYPYKGDNRFADASVRFTEDKYLFFLQDVSYAQKFSGAMDSYGILPIPKFDTEQKEYLSYGRPMVTGIAADAKDPDMAAAVLESLHCESKKTMMPAYYDIALSSRYASTPEASEMLDLIFANVSVDFAQIWYSSIGLSLPLHNSCGCVEDYASWYAGISNQFNANLEKLLGSIRDVRDAR